MHVSTSFPIHREREREEVIVVDRSLVAVRRRRYIERHTQSSWTVVGVVATRREQQLQTKRRRFPKLPAPVGHDIVFLELVVAMGWCPYNAHTYTHRHTQTQTCVFSEVCVRETHSIILNM